jgi:D-amino-acid dehydrogenase
MAYKTAHAEREEAEVVRWAKELGITVNHYSKEEVSKLQPEAPMDIAGAYWYESDAHSTPELFMKNLKAHLTAQGS